MSLFTVRHISILRVDRPSNPTLHIWGYTSCMSTLSSPAQPASQPPVCSWPTELSQTTPRWCRNGNNPSLIGLRTREPDLHSLVWPFINHQQPLPDILSRSHARGSKSGVQPSVISQPLKADCLNLRIRLTTEQDHITIAYRQSSDRSHETQFHPCV